MQGPRRPALSGHSFRPPWHPSRHPGVLTETIGQYKGGPPAFAGRAKPPSAFPDRTPHPSRSTRSPGRWENRSAPEGRSARPTCPRRWPCPFGFCVREWVPTGRTRLRGGPTAIGSHSLARCQSLAVQLPCNSWGVVSLVSFSPSNK